MRMKRHVPDEQLYFNSGYLGLVVLMLPPAVYLTAVLVVQIGWLLPVLTLVLLTNLPLTLYHLWKAWYPFHILYAATRAVDLTDDQLRILSYLKSPEMRRHTWAVGAMLAALLGLGAAGLLAAGIVTLAGLPRNLVLRPSSLFDLFLFYSLIVIFNALAVEMALIGWPCWRAHRHWDHIVQTYPLYDLANFRRDFRASSEAREGLGGPRRFRTTPVPSPLSQPFSTPLRWSQGVGAAVFFIGLPAIFVGITGLSRSLARGTWADVAFDAGLVALGSLLLVLGWWLWKK